MLRAHHIVLRQWQAGQIFRAAWDVLYGSIGGVMDLDRIRGAGLPGSPPPPRQLYAAEKLAEAKRQIYTDDWPVLSAVAGEGHSLEKTTFRLLGHCSKADRTAMGNRLRACLTQLAERWVPEASKQPTRSYHRPLDPTSVEAARGTTVDSVMPGRVAHASSRGVKMTG